jgi:hypothetical protein
VTDEQRRLVEAQRCLVWWYYADLKAYNAGPLCANASTASLAGSPASP